MSADGATRSILDQHGAAARDAFERARADLPLACPNEGVQRAFMGYWLATITRDISDLLKVTTEPGIDVRARLVAWTSLFSKAAAEQAGL